MATTPVGTTTTLNETQAQQRQSDGRQSGPRRQVVRVTSVLTTPEDNSGVVHGTQRTAAGFVDVKLAVPPIILRGVKATTSVNGNANSWPLGQRFEVEMPIDLFERFRSGGSITDADLSVLTAYPMTSKATEVHEVTAKTPLSTSAKLANLFTGKGTYANDREQLRKQCILDPPKSLAEAIEKLKIRNPYTLRMIPPAAQVKQGWYEQNIYDGPVAEVGRNGIQLRTDNGAGMSMQGDSTAFHGIVYNDAKDNIYPQQLTGIPAGTMPGDDFLPQGTVLFPHPKRYPVVIQWVQTLLPILDVMFVQLPNWIKVIRSA